MERGERRAGFTLIEMIAVVALIGMIFALGIPRLSSSRWRALGDAAESIAASLEYARQRAVLTGIPHRVLIDLADGGWRVEWLVGEQEALSGGGDPGSLVDPLASLDPNSPIDLHPPVRRELDYHPIANRQLGSFSWLEERLYFVGLDSPSGWIESGDVQIVFDADGTTDHVLLEIADADDRHMTLEIEPMLERVRRRSGPARS